LFVFGRKKRFGNNREREEIAVVRPLCDLQRPGGRKRKPLLTCSNLLGEGEEK